MNVALNKPFSFHLLTKVAPPPPCYVMSVLFIAVSDVKLGGCKMVRKILNKYDDDDERVSRH